MSKIIAGRFGGGRFGDLQVSGFPKPTQPVVASGGSVDAIEPVKATANPRRGAVLTTLVREVRRAA